MCGSFVAMMNDRKQRNQKCHFRLLIDTYNTRSSSAECGLAIFLNLETSLKNQLGKQLAKILRLRFLDLEVTQVYCRQSERARFNRVLIRVPD